MGCQCHVKGKNQDGSQREHKCNCTFSFVPCNCPHVFGTNNYLRKNLKKTKVNKRIAYLANPKNRPIWNQPKICKKFGRSIEIVKEPKISTRLEHLAVRPVRHLISARDEYKHFISKYWYQRFNKLIHKSLYTMYSRLANITLPELCEKPEKWTIEDWKRHKIWLEKRAQPKKEFKEKREKNQWKDISKLIPRIEKLANPKKRFIRKKYTTNLTTFKSQIKKAAKEYMATEHICQLSQPYERKQREKGIEEDDNNKISPHALVHNATERTQSLAQPKKINKSGNEIKENPFGVIPRALKAICSPRIEELAKAIDR